jgi:hypothetical protein
MTCVIQYAGSAFPLHAPRQRSAQRDRGVEVAAGDRAEGVHAGEHRQAERERHTQKPMPSDTPSAEANLAANTALPQPPRTSQNV